ncbi:hypothetical protein [Streptomyces sp. NPDC002232]|uniref:hypothetical protein n=1 Tax=Streptomyces sp. NPDC002232 TaxID=3364640 RepID=UPI0036807473
MAKNSVSSTAVPDTAWLGRGRHLGPEPERDVRRNLLALKAARVIDDFLDLDPVEAARSTDLYPRDESADPGPSARRVFEARWRPAEGVTVRAQLTTYAPESRRSEGEGVTWVLGAEAERPWEADWPSPATVFWPDSDQVVWDHDTVADVRLRTANHLPQDDGELRRLLRACTRQSWFLHVVVHEAMTPDTLGRRPVTAFLPPGLRHRVVEHRAAPDQVLAVDFAMKRELGVGLSRGGAVVLPPASYSLDDTEHLTVRNVFLDGTEPTELLGKIAEFAALPQRLPADAEPVLTRLRQGWHLLTPDEELAHARGMVTQYARALEAMTASCDLYREAAESALEALAEAKGGDSAPRAASPATAREEASPWKSLTKTLSRFRGPATPHAPGATETPEPPHGS